MNERIPPALPDIKTPKIFRGKPIINRQGEIIGWAVRGDGSLDYLDQKKEDIWIEIKPNRK